MASQSTPVFGDISKSFTITSVLLLSTAVGVMAQSPPKSAVHFDEDSIPGLSASEALSACNYIASTLARSGIVVDSNADGKLRGAEITSIKTKFEKNFSNELELCLDAVREISSRYRGQEQIPADELSRDYDGVFPRAFVQPRPGQFTTAGDKNTGDYNVSSTGIVVRRSHQDIRLHTVDNRSIIRGEGALLAYTRDFANKADTYQATGAFAYPLLFQNNNDFERGSTYLDEIALVPSLSFDRVENTGAPARKVDSLTFRMGSEWKIRNAFGIPSQFFWFDATYNTDFGFDTEIFAGEVDWRPVNRSFGIGQALSLGGSDQFLFRWKPQLHFEWGYVVDSAGNPNIRAKQDFARVGPEIDVDLWIGAQTKLYLNYHYYAALTAGTRSSRMLVAGLEYSLDPDTNHWTLDINYRKGRTPFQQTRTETLMAGFGVKF